MPQTQTPQELRDTVAAALIAKGWKLAPRHPSEEDRATAYAIDPQRRIDRLTLTVPLGLVEVHLNPDSYLSHGKLLARVDAKINSSDREGLTQDQRSEIWRLENLTTPNAEMRGTVAAGIIRRIEAEAAALTALMPAAAEKLAAAVAYHLAATVATANQRKLRELLATVPGLSCYDWQDYIRLRVEVGADYGATLRALAAAALAAADKVAP